MRGRPERYATGTDVMAWHWLRRCTPNGHDPRFTNHAPPQRVEETSDGLSWLAAACSAHK